MMQYSPNFNSESPVRDFITSVLRHIFNYDASADAFGNALGNSIDAGMQSKPKPNAQKTHKEGITYTNQDGTTYWWMASAVRAFYDR